MQHTYMMVAFFCLFSAACFWMIFNQPKPTFILKVTCNGIVVIQKELVELENMCDNTDNGNLKWQFYPAEPVTNFGGGNVVTIEIVRI